jgi:hypothetical protein
MNALTGGHLLSEVLRAPDAKKQSLRLDRHGKTVRSGTDEREISLSTAAIERDVRFPLVGNASLPSGTSSSG